MTTDISSTRFLHPLASDADRYPAPPVLLGHGRVVDQVEVVHRGWTGYFKPPEGTFRPDDVRPFLDDDGCYTVKCPVRGLQQPDSQQMELLRGSAVELLANAEAITAEKPLKNFNVMVNSQNQAYGDPLPLTQGIHVDFRPQESEPHVRRFHIVAGKPFPLIWFEGMSARKAYYTRQVQPRMVAYSEPKAYYRKRMRRLEPNRYLGLQELTPHTSVDVARDFKSYDDVAATFGNDASLMRWFRPDGFTRIFQCASAQYAVATPV